ncbi:hypothetical protein F5X99DRAFT_270067 [Biscogniauxia marginata]|nr:hypothetical protein F5X99DRAFT_270067 [Biscogniauxia marginata]
MAGHKAVCSERTSTLTSEAIHMLYKIATSRTVRPIVPQHTVTLGVPRTSLIANINSSATLDSVVTDVEPTSMGSQKQGSQATGTNGSYRPIPSTTISISKARELQRQKIIADHRPTIDTIFKNATLIDPVELRTTLHEAYDALFGQQNGVSFKEDTVVLQTSEVELTLISSPVEVSKIALRQDRRSQDARFLQVPVEYNEEGDDVRSVKCPVCRWDLLSRPQNKPDVPIISVTDPTGMVRYPQDHTYYHGDGGSNDDSDTYD